MQSTRQPCFLVTLLLFLLLVSVANGAEPTDAADAVAAASNGGKRITVRTGTAGHAGHGYNSHSGAHPTGDTPEQGGAGVVDPRNQQAARSHHRNATSSRVIGHSFPAICALLGVLVMVVLV